MRNDFAFPSETTDSHVILRRSKAEAELRLDPMDKLAVFKGFLHGNQLAANRDDRQCGLLHLAADTSAPLAKGLCNFGRQRFVVESVDDLALPQIAGVGNRKMICMGEGVGHHRDPPTPAKTDLRPANMTRTSGQWPQETAATAG